MKISLKKCKAHSPNTQVVYKRETYIVRETDTRKWCKLSPWKSIEAVQMSIEKESLESSVVCSQS